MKKIEGMNFSVRFFRRGVAKGAVKSAPPQGKEEKMLDIPEQVEIQRIVKTDMAQEKALHDAAVSGDCAAIRMLVINGVDLDARDEMGRTALNIATQNNHSEAIKTLMAAKDMRRLATAGDLPDTDFFRKFKQGKTA